MNNEETKKENPELESLKKELEDFIDVAKKEKGKIESLGASITAKSEEIELYHASFVEMRTKLSDGTTGLDAVFNQSTNLKNQIEQINTNAQTDLNQITEKVNSINIKIQEMETYYGSFVDLRNKLGDSQTRLQALLDQATILKNNIVQVDIESKASLEKINENVTSITAKVSEIEAYYTNTFLPLKEKIDDDKTGLQAILGSATNLKNEIVKTKAGTDESFREIKNLTDQSLKLKDQSQKTTIEIEELKNRSAEFKTDIEQTFKIATDVSLANSFNERKKDLQVESDKWLRNVEYSTLLLAVVVLVIFASQYIGDIKVYDWKFWYRFAFTSPIIFYIAFASHNYNKVRDLLEKYAFKFATSLSLQSYTKLLTDNFKEKEHKDDLLRFAIRSIDMIYKEPYAQKDKTRKFSVGNKIINIGLEDIETLAKENINIEEIIAKKEPNKAS